MMNLPTELREHGIHYTLRGDYYLPDIAVTSMDNRLVNRWGHMLEAHLKNYHPSQYSQMVLNGTLHTMLADISEQAETRREVLISQMREDEQVDEALKARDQMAWVGSMNSIADRVNEIILAELIYA